MAHKVTKGAGASAMRWRIPVPSTQPVMGAGSSGVAVSPGYGVCPVSPPASQAEVSALPVHPDRVSKFFFPEKRKEGTPSSETEEFEAGWMLRRILPSVALPYFVLPIDEHVCAASPEMLKSRVDALAGRLARPRLPDAADAVATMINYENAGATLADMLATRTLEIVVGAALDGPLAALQATLDVGLMMPDLREPNIAMARDGDGRWVWRFIDNGETMLQSDFVAACLAGAAPHCLFMKVLCPEVFLVYKLCVEGKPFDDTTLGAVAMTFAGIASRLYRIHRRPVPKWCIPEGAFDRLRDVQEAIVEAGEGAITPAAIAASGALGDVTMHSLGCAFVRMAAVAPVQDPLKFVIAELGKRMASQHVGSGKARMSFLDVQDHIRAAIRAVPDGTDAAPGGRRRGRRLTFV